MWLEADEAERQENRGQSVTQAWPRLQLAEASRLRTSRGTGTLGEVSGFTEKVHSESADNELLILSRIFLFPLCQSIFAFHGISVSRERHLWGEKLNVVLGLG